MPGPLHGVRIIDVSEVISGPLAVMVLAEQGADVIKIEPPKHGEESRQLANYREGMAALYLNCNQGKRSIGLNLKITSRGHHVWSSRKQRSNAGMIDHPLKVFDHASTPGLRSTGAVSGEHGMKNVVVEKTVLDKMDRLKQCMNGDSIFTRARIILPAGIILRGSGMSG